MFVNYAELLLPSNSSVVLPEAQIATPRHIKLGSGFGVFLSFFKKTQQNKTNKKIPKTQNHNKTTKQRRYFKMIIRFQQGGINLTVLDPGAAHNWLPLQSCGLDYLQIWSLSCHRETQSCEAR